MKCHLDIIPNEHSGTWDERLEHIARHMEDVKRGTVESVDPEQWQKDESMEEWLVQEAIIVPHKWGYTLGDGSSHKKAAKQPQKALVDLPKDPDESKVSPRGPLEDEIRDQFARERDPVQLPASVPPESPIYHFKTPVQSPRSANDLMPAERVLSNLRQLRYEYENLEIDDETESSETCVDSDQKAGGNAPDHFVGHVKNLPGSSQAITACGEQGSVSFNASAGTEDNGQGSSQRSSSSKNHDRGEEGDDKEGRPRKIQKREHKPKGNHGAPGEMILCIEADCTGQNADMSTFS